MEAQRVAANQAAQAVAERAQSLHNEAVAHIESQARSVVQATFQEASVTVEQLRLELQHSEAKRLELTELGRVLEQQLKDCRAELVKAEAELNALRFQLSQAKIEAQVKDREIHRLRSAAPSATDAPGQPKFYDLNVASSSSGVAVDSGCSVPQPSSPVVDPRVDQLIEAVQQLASRLEQPNGTDQGGLPSEDEDLSERKIVDNRALLHLKFDPIPDSAAGFRAWRNALLVQVGKLDQSGQGLVHKWISEAFQLERDELEDSGLLPRLDSFLASEMTSTRVLRQVPDLEQEITSYVELCGQLGTSPKGRYMLALLSRFFDLDRVRGSVLTASTLFQVEISGNSMKDLKDFVQRVRIVLSQIPIGPPMIDLQVSGSFTGSSTFVSSNAQLKTFGNPLVIQGEGNGLSCGTKSKTS